MVCRLMLETPQRSGVVQKTGTDARSSGGGLPAKATGIGANGWVPEFLEARLTARSREMGTTRAALSKDTAGERN